MGIFSRTGGVVPAEAARVAWRSPQRADHDQWKNSLARETTTPVEANPTMSALPARRIGKLARIGVIAAPTSGVRSEGRKGEDGWRKVSVSSGERDKDSSRGESDDVCLLATVHIGKLARIGVIAAPTSGVRTEGRKFEGGWRKVSVSSGERDKDSGRGESDDVGLPVTVHIGKLARIGVIPALPDALPI